MSETLPNKIGGGVMVVCDDCGRVNIVRKQTVGLAHCSGCGSLLQGVDAPQVVRKECPSCMAMIEVDESMVGKEVACPDCGVSVQIDPAATASLPGLGADGEKSGIESLGKGGRRKRRGRRSRRPKQDRTKLKAALIPTFCVLLALLAAGIIIREEGYWDEWMGNVKEEDREAAQVSPAAANRADEAGIVLRAADHMAIQRALQGFLAAAEPADRLRQVRFAAVIAPRFEHYYRNNLMLPGVLAHFDIIKAAVHDGRLFVLVDVEMADGRSVRCILERTPEGGFLVDWDAYVQYGSMDWTSFLTLMPEQPQRFCLMAKGTSHYHRNYPPERYTPFLLFRNEPHDGVAVFVPRGSEEERVFLEVTSHESDEQSVEPGPRRPGVGAVTVEVSFDPDDRVEGSTLNVQLDELVHGGWVNLAPGFSHVGTEPDQGGGANATSP